MAGTYAKYSLTSGGGGGGGGGVTSINGDTSSAQLITGGTGITVATSGGNTTITSASTGNVVGPASSVTNTLPTFSGTTGKLLQDTATSLLSPGTDNIFLNAGNASVTGTHNLGVLSGALSALTTASNNIAIGQNALHAATTSASGLGGFVAIGHNALAAYVSDAGAPNGGGDEMIAIGDSAFAATTVSDGSVAIGNGAGSNYVSGSFYNTHVGVYAGNGNSAGSYNTSLGYDAISNISANYTGSNNTALGYQALGNLGATDNESNVAVGSNTGNTYPQYTQATLLGTQADTGANNLTNATAVGFGAKVAASNTMQLGNSSLTQVITSAKYISGDVTSKIGGLNLGWGAPGGGGSANITFGAGSANPVQIQGGENGANPSLSFTNGNGETVVMYVDNNGLSVLQNASFTGSKTTVEYLNVDGEYYGNVIYNPASPYGGTKSDSVVLLDPASTLASFTITMPAPTLDAMVYKITTGNTTGGVTVTAFTLTPNAGQTINAAPTTLAANTTYKWLWQAGTSKWYRMTA